MKKNEKRKHKTLRGVFVLPLMFILICFVNCKSDGVDIGRVVTPPDLTKSSTIKSYFPDSGGVATKLILYGTNFGSDTSYLKVSINGKNAKIIGAADTVLYAIVPCRADTGLVEVMIGKGANVDTFAYTNPFKYQFKRNVTTVFGQKGQVQVLSGAYADVCLQRPWFVTFDNEGTMFFIDEGRGTNNNGALRKAYGGVVSTLIQNSSGPFQSPTCLAFNLAQDTLFMLNSLWITDNMSTTATVTSFTRATNFSICKQYININQTSKATALAIHPKTGDIFFNSQVDGYIYKYDKSTQLPVEQFQVNGTDTELKMVFSLDGKTLYIMVKNKHCIYKADYNAETGTVENPVLWAGQWNASGFLNATGKLALFNTPGQGAVDSDGNLYVPDKKNHCIRKITKAGLVSTYAGIPQTSGYADGDPSTSLFNEPECVSFSPDGGLYVTDRSNSLMRKIMVE